MQPTCLAASRSRQRPGAPATSASDAHLFPDLPALTTNEAFLFALGRAGGLCDCGTGEDEPASLGTQAAGWPFFGQFIAHDITADRSALRSHLDASRLKNARSPQLNLECLYGDGPVGHPFLFQQGDPVRLLTAPGGHDVQRNAEGTAIIGDPRNDSHMLMSQLHLAFVHAHNAFVDRGRAHGVPEPEIFETASRELRWHYQAAILNEFLPALVGKDRRDGGDAACNRKRRRRPWSRPPGNGNNDVNWLKVRVNARSREVFTYQPQIVPANRTAVPAP